MKYLRIYRVSLDPMFWRKIESDYNKLVLENQEDTSEMIRARSSMEVTRSVTFRCDDKIIADAHVNIYT
jgi:hypothetical protein